MIEVEFDLWRQYTIKVSININWPTRDREITIRRSLYRRKTFWVVLLKPYFAYHPKALSTMSEILGEKNRALEEVNYDHSCIYAKRGNRKIWGRRAEDPGFVRRTPPPLGQHPSPSWDLINWLTNLKGSWCGWVSPMTQTPMRLEVGFSWCIMEQGVTWVTRGLAGCGVETGLWLTKLPMNQRAITWFLDIGISPLDFSPSR